MTCSLFIIVSRYPEGSRQLSVGIRVVLLVVRLIAPSFFFQYRVRYVNQRVYSCLGAGHSVGHLGNLLWIYPGSYSEKLSFDYWINGRRVGSSARWEGPTTSFSAVKWWLPMA